jgi:hypothetical protein
VGIISPVLCLQCGGRVMYQGLPDGTRDQLGPGDVIPSGICQPPLDAMELMKRLSLEELQDVTRTMIIWAPEAFERGLQRVSHFREIRGWYPARAGSSANEVPGLSRG